jgi:hypothetical protein
MEINQKRAAVSINQPEGERPKGEVLVMREWKQKVKTLKRRRKRKRRRPRRKEMESSYPRSLLEIWLIC